ncbi:MAG: DUF4350 domain-containing protein [Thermofilaceae archaeon]|nr:DUF4350 domain-containing protein [Thermofilaceae archaeon]
MRRQLILTPLVATAVTLLTVTLLYPLSDDFHPQNPFWNGMDAVAKQYETLRVQLSEAFTLNSSSYTLLIVGPSKHFTSDDVKAVEWFLAKGGRIIIADDYGTANQLLEMLDVPVRVVRGTLQDPLLNLGSPHLPLARWGGESVALNYAAALNVSLCRNCRVLVESYVFSYLDLNFNNLYDEGEPEGPLPVAASLFYGAGELIIISDSSLFITSMLKRESNLKLLDELLSGTQPALVVSHWDESTLARIKNAIETTYLFFKISELKYTLVIVVFLISYKLGKKLSLIK